MDPTPSGARQRTRLTPGTIPRAVRFSARYRWQIVGFLVVAGLTAVLGVVPAFLLRMLVDRAIPDADRGLVGTIALSAIGLAVVMASFGMLARYLTSRVGEGITHDLRMALFEHTQRMSLAFFTRAKTGSLMSRLQSDVLGAQAAVTVVLQTFVSSLITIIVIVAAMTALDWRLTLVAFASAPLFAIPSVRTTRALQRVVREQMHENAELSSVLQERFDVSGAQLTKLFGRPQDEVARVGARVRRLRDLGIRSALLFMSVFALFALVASISAATVYWLGGIAAIEGRLKPGDVVAFVILLGQIFPPLSSLAQARNSLLTSFISFERVFELLDLAPQVADPVTPVGMPEGAGRIEFNEVSFRYPAASEVSIASLELAPGVSSESEGREILHDISFTAEAGTTTALVGPSGAGKTTISMLVPRLYDVGTGAVLVDGVDVRTVTQADLRATIGVVNQDPHLFHDTIGENLRFARPDATDDEVRDAIRAAHLEEVIARLPDGLDTLVGERGYRMSGGEKQRLAIARVLLKRPRIVILDEATAHLDSASEALVQQAFAEALRGRTAIVIAHRLSTILGADQILVIADGRIVQRGPHAKLLQEQGIYRGLYRTQFAVDDGAAT